MSQANYRFFLLTILMLFQFSGQSGNPPGYRTRNKFTRFGIAPVVGFYSIDSKHAAGPKSRMSFSGFFRREWSMDPSNRVFFVTGLETLFHGVSYHSYYFDQDTLQLYTGEFNYIYRLSIVELNVPLQTKFTFKSTSNSAYTPYVALSYQLRYLLSCKSTVESDGTVVKADNVDLQFKNPFLYKKINSCAAIAIGFQTNPIRNNTTSFFIEVMGRYGFSPYFFKADYSASSVYINSAHLSLNIGVGF